MYYPVNEIIKKKVKIYNFWNSFFSFSVVAMFSLSYELIEIITAFIVAPDLGIAYLGIQGDLLDGQKDSFLALTGAFISMLFLYLKDKVKYL